MVLFYEKNLNLTKMKIWVVYDSFIPRRMDFLALTLYPWVLISKPKHKATTQLDRDTLKHEMVHVRQARRHGLVMFYLLYVYCLLLLLYKCGGNLYEAYMKHPFEQEAYGEETDSLTLEELEELFAVGALNVFCLRREELEILLKCKGLPTKGSKAVLAKRIAQSLSCSKDED